MPSKKEVREQKDKTKKMLMDAALQLIADEGFANLSLRSVARAGGIAPTSFYRFFRDVDELGLELIEEVEVSLREYLTIVRERADHNRDQTKQEPLIEILNRLARTEISAFMDYLHEHETLFRLFLQERTGSNEILRKAISKKTQRFIDFIVHELEFICQKKNFPMNDIPLVAEMVVLNVMHDGIAALDLPEEDKKYEIERMIKKVRLILAGAYALGKDILD
ncbi:MAG: HTH-type transcriptional repressor FabR [SAR324 cluster bacterium]|nr:HTH-type transcriptional repressor FabR [SAR324 cluster bacterium]